MALQQPLLRSFVPQARELVHKRKASASVVGAQRIAELCALIEAPELDPGQSLADLANQLQTEMGSVETAIAGVLAHS